MSVDLVRADDRPHVADLRLGIGDHNRLRSEPLAGLREVIETLPNEVAVVTVAATGAAPGTDGTRGLSTGLDLEGAVGRGPAKRRVFPDELYAAIQVIRDADAVTIAACGEYALVAGFELALGWDFRVATADAALGLPEVDIGLPTVVQGGLLVDHVGLGRAKELVYRGTILTGIEARADGLIVEAPTADSYPAAVGSLLDELTAKAPAVLRTQKRAFRLWRSAGHEAGLRESAAIGGRACGTDAAREGIPAFLEARDPEFGER